MTDTTTAAVAAPTTSAPSASATITTAAPATAAPANQAAPQAAPQSGFLVDKPVTQPTDPTEAKTETGERPSWLPERFKTPEDLAKSYTELDTKLKAGVVDDAHVEEAVKTNNLSWQSDQQKTTDISTFKELGLKPTQVDGLLKMYGERLNSIVAQYGTPPDFAKESTALKEAWGDEMDSRTAEVRQFANTLPPAVVQRLHTTAEGMQFMHDLMTERRGPGIIKESVATGPEDIDARMREITRDPLYFQQNDPKGVLLRKEMMMLAERRNRSR